MRATLRIDGQGGMSALTHVSDRSSKRFEYCHTTRGMNDNAGYSLHCRNLHPPASPVNLADMKSIRIPIALHQAVMQCLHAKQQQADAYFSCCFPELALSYRQRGTIAGTAWLDQWEIRLNPVLLLANEASFIDEVIPHELAHLLVYRQFGRVAPHGKEWRWMMASVLNTEPRRTHEFDLATVRTNTFHYLCACQSHQLTVRRHNRILRGEAQYRCRHCGDVLRFAQ